MAQPRLVDTDLFGLPMPAVLAYGFRPFFLFAAAFATLALPAWLAMLAHGYAPAGPFDALRWHVHEMTFGYLGAVIAGFILTAVPNWTGRLPVNGARLAGLAALWLAGRIAVAWVAQPVWALGIDGAFLVVLAAAVWREIVRGNNARNLPVAVIITLFALANIAFHLEEIVDLPAGLATRLALGVAAMLIGLIGGRIIPSFTGNWLKRAGKNVMPAPFGRFDKLTIAAAAIAVAAWIGWPDSTATGVLMLVAGALHLARLARWCGLQTLASPIVAVLHLGYLWLAVAFALIGASALAPDAIGPTSALHALTAGAIGTMTLAVMTRASLGHTGREIATDARTFAIYALVTVGAVVRVLAPLAPEHYLVVVAAGGLIWTGAFAVFTLGYGPMLLTRGAGRI